MKPRHTPEDRARWTADMRAVNAAARRLALALSRANRRPLAVTAVKPPPFDKRRGSPAEWDVEVREASAESSAGVAMWTADEFRAACEAADAGRAQVFERRAVARAAPAAPEPRDELPADVRAWMDEYRRTGRCPAPLPREAA